jgi:hypothetical protein
VIFSVAVTDDQIRKLQAVAAIGGGIVALHGITSRRWQRWHTVFGALAIAASALPLVVRRSR